MLGVVDRIEGNIAVLELDNNTFQKITLDKIKGKVKEGDVLGFRDGFYYIDKEETDKREKEAKDFLDLWD